MIKGKAVHGLQTSFLLDWFFVDQTLLTSSRFFPALDSKGDSLAQIVTSEPTSQWKEIMQGLCLAISSAKEYFYIQTPYFLPTEPILAALQIAALAGVDVRLMLPEHDEISAIMGISKTNVGTRISRIKEQIKQLAITKI